MRAGHDCVCCKLALTLAGYNVQVHSGYTFTNTIQMTQESMATSMPESSRVALVTSRDDLEVNLKAASVSGSAWRRRALDGNVMMKCGPRRRKDGKAPTQRKQAVVSQRHREARIPGDYGSGYWCGLAPSS